MEDVEEDDEQDIDDFDALVKAVEDNPENLSKEVHRKQQSWKTQEADFQKKIERESLKLEEKMNHEAKKYIIKIVLSFKL